MNKIKWGIETVVTSELNYYHGGCWDETETGTSRTP